MAKVGLLEDNVRLAWMCATMLEYAGYQVSMYKTPRECLDALIPSEKNAAPKCVSIARLPIEVLILDLKLPEIGGLGVLHTLQANPDTQTLPLVFCTASHTSEITRALRIAPYAGVVEKPFKIETLLSAITTALDQRAK